MISCRRSWAAGGGGTGPFRSRVAGGFVSDLHRADLRGTCLLERFRPGDRWQLKSALEFSRGRPEPLVVHADILADSVAPVAMEILLAPLRGPVGGVDRFIGLYQPTAMISRLQGRPALALAIGGISRADGGEAAPSLRLASVDGRRIA